MSLLLLVPLLLHVSLLLLVPLLLLVSLLLFMQAVTRTPCVAFTFAALALLFCKCVICSPAVAGVLYVETNPAVEKRTVFKLNCFGHKQERGFLRFFNDYRLADWKLAEGPRNFRISD